MNDTVISKIQFRLFLNPLKNTVDLPRQILVVELRRQHLISISFPLHGRPPYLASLLTFLLLEIFPCPHVVEQELHVPQESHLQSTTAM